MAAVLCWRLPGWRLPTQVRRPGSRAFQKRCMPMVWDLSGQAIPTGRRPRRPGPRSRLPRRRPASLGTTGSPQHRPHRRNCSVAGRQRHQFPGPATNRRKPTRNASGTVETTPRSGCRACHRPASRCKGRRAAVRRTWAFAGPQPAPPKTRTASGRAVRARPIAHHSPRLRRSEHEVARHATTAGTQTGGTGTKGPPSDVWS